MSGEHRKSISQCTFLLSLIQLHHFDYFLLTLLKTSDDAHLQTLNKFTCIALAGVVTEYLLFGTAEGGLSDINTVLFQFSLFIYLYEECVFKLYKTSSKIIF